MAIMSREDSRIRDGVRDSKIRLDIPRKFNQKVGSFTSELNRSKDGNRCHEEECYLSQYITSRIRMKIRFFNGSPVHFVEWTEAVEDFFLQMDIPEQLKCKIASYSLEGETDKWWQQLQHTRAENGEPKISSWEEMKRQLIRYCFPPVSSKLYHIQSSRAKQEEKNEGNNSKEDESPRGRADKFIPSMCLTKCPNQLNKPKEAEMIEYIQADGSILAKCSMKVPSESYSSEWDKVKELKLQKSVDVCKGEHEAEQALGVETEYNMVEELSGKVPIIMLPKIIEHEVIELLEAKRSTINMKEGVWHEGSDPKIMELEHTAVAIVISKEHLHIDAIALHHLSKVPTLNLSFHNLFAVKLSIMFDPGGKWQNKRTGNDGHVSMTGGAPTLVDSDATTLERVKLKFMNNRHLPTVASVMTKRFWEPICISNNQNSKLSYEHRGNIRAEELKWMTRVVVVLKFSLDDNKRSTCLDLGECKIFNHFRTETTSFLIDPGGKVYLPDNWVFKHHCLSYSNSSILMEDKIGTLVYNSPSHRVVGSTENEVIMMVLNLGAYDVDFLIKETLMCSFDPGGCGSINQLTDQLSFGCNLRLDIMNESFYEEIKVIVPRSLLHRAERHAAKKMLTKTITLDSQAVRRHTTTILDSAKESDATFRKRALELLYVRMNDRNVKPATNVLIHYLEEGDLDCRGYLTAKMLIGFSVANRLLSEVTRIWIYLFRDECMLSNYPISNDVTFLFDPGGVPYITMIESFGNYFYLSLFGILLDCAILRINGVNEVLSVKSEITWNLHMKFVCIHCWIHSWLPVLVLKLVACYYMMRDQLGSAHHASKVYCHNYILVSHIISWKFVFEGLQFMIAIEINLWKLIFMVMLFSGKIVPKSNLQIGANFNRARGRAIPWEGWNDENSNMETNFIMGNTSLSTFSSILGDNGKFKKTLKMFHKVVNGLDPPDGS